MNNKISITNKSLLLLSLVLSFTGCSGADTHNTTDISPISEISFEDERLKTCVEETGAQTVEDLTTLVCLYITSPVGLEQLTHLKHLELALDNVNTLDLSSLVELEEIALVGYSSISVYLPESGRLKHFSLRGGIIENINLQTQTQLEELHLSAGNSGEDLGDFSKFSSLNKLYIVGSISSEFILPIDSSLKSLYYGDSNSKNIDFTHQSELKELILYDSGIADRLDISQITKLERLTYYTSGTRRGFGNQLTKIDVSQNKELVYLNLAYSRIEELDLSNNAKLQTVNLAGADLIDLDISHLTDLTDLDLYGSELVSFEGTASLVTLQLQSNKLETIDLSASKDLQTLNASYNKLTDVDLSANSRLTKLKLNNNQLTEFSTNGLDGLDALNLSSNQLAGLDITQLGSLKVLDLKYNKLNSLFIPDDIELFELNLSDNPGVCSLIPARLHKILGDRVFACDYSQISNDTIAKSEKTPLEQLVFEDKFLASCVMATGEIYAEDVHELNCNQVQSVEGIGQLSQLYSLKLQFSKVSLDLSSVPSLRVLEIEFGELKSLNLSQNYELEFISVFYTEGISEFDFSSQNKLVSLNLYPLTLSDLSLDSTGLINLEVTGYQSLEYDLGNLDLSSMSKLKSFLVRSPDDASFDFNFSANVDLQYLSFEEINFSSEILQQLPKLKGLSVDRTKISGIDFSQNVQLESLQLTNTSLKSLDLSALINLRKLALGYNDLSSLNVRPLTALAELNVAYNNLQSIDLSYNHDLKFAQLDSKAIEEASLPNSSSLQIQLRGRGLAPDDLIDLVESGYVDADGVGAYSRVWIP